MKTTNRLIVAGGRASHAAIRQRGVSLVELMISIALGLVIVAALSVLFVDTSRTNREMAKANAMIENGRFAIQVLEGEVVHAGFWGEYVPRYDDFITDTPLKTEIPTLVPDPCRAYGGWTQAHRINLISIVVQPDYSTESWNSTDAKDVCTAVLVDAQANSDVIVVRHAETCSAGKPNCAATEKGTMYFQSSRYAGPPPPEKLPTTFALEEASDDTASNFDLKLKDGVTPAPLRRLVSDVYYVRTWARDSGESPKIPTLVRVRFDGTTEALVEGVESLRIEYGIDAVSKTGEAVKYWDSPPSAEDPADGVVVTGTYPGTTDSWTGIHWSDPKNKVTPRNRGDGVPDSFVRCTRDAPSCTASQLANVTALKLYVLARGRDFSPGFNDNKTYAMGSAPTICSTAGSCTLKTLDPTYKRQVFSTTVRLANVVQRRETP